SKTATKTTKTESKAKPVCSFGTKCYRTSSAHLAMYSHAEKGEAEEEILDTRDLIEPDEPASPTAIDAVLAKDKNKGLTFD
ncbi:unnamed protein product, partial [Rotaria magnacalcarata]